MTPIAVKPREAAKMLSISLATLWRWVRKGRLSPVRIDGVVLFRVSELERVVGE